MRPRTRRIGLALAGIALATSGSIMACAGIVGVEDVRLRRDSGSTADALDEVEIVVADTGPIPPPPPGANILEVALGAQHTCARKTDNTVKCWGDNSHSQTATVGAADGGLVVAPAAVAVTDALHIAAGQYHTCVVRKSGKVSCWGENLDGQLGNGDASGGRSATPVDAVGITDAKGIACGASFSCALRTGGGVACWGNRHKRGIPFHGISPYYLALSFSSVTTPCLSDLLQQPIRMIVSKCALLQLLIRQCS